jgi:hypothetical protein
MAAGAMKPAMVNSAVYIVITAPRRFVGVISVTMAKLSGAVF